MSGRGSDEGGYRPFSGAYGRLGSGKGIEGQTVINQADFGDDDAMERVLARSRQDVSADGGVGAAASDIVNLLDCDVFKRVSSPPPPTPHVP
eukprot:3801965-Pyramimonas_sp.AAC.1